MQPRQATTTFPTGCVSLTYDQSKPFSLAVASMLVGWHEATMSEVVNMLMSVVCKCNSQQHY